LQKKRAKKEINCKKKREFQKKLIFFLLFEERYIETIIRINTHNYNYNYNYNYNTTTT